MCYTHTQTHDRYKMQIDLHWNHEMIGGTFNTSNNNNNNKQKSEFSNV